MLPFFAAGWKKKNFSRINMCVQGDRLYIYENKIEKLIYIFSNIYLGKIFSPNFSFLDKNLYFVDFFGTSARNWYRVDENYYWN